MQKRNILRDIHYNLNPNYDFDVLDGYTTANYKHWDKFIDATKNREPLNTIDSYMIAFDGLKEALQVVIKDDELLSDMLSILRLLNNDTVSVLVKQIDSYFMENPFHFALDIIEALQEFAFNKKDPDLIFKFSLELILNATEVETVKVGLILLATLENYDSDDNVIRILKALANTAEFGFYSSFILKDLKDGDKYLEEVAYYNNNFARNFAIFFMSKVDISFAKKIANLDDGWVDEGYRGSKISDNPFSYKLDLYEYFDDSLTDLEMKLFYKEIYLYVLNGRDLIYGDYFLKLANKIYDQKDTYKHSIYYYLSLYLIKIGLERTCKNKDLVDKINEFFNNSSIADIAIESINISVSDTVFALNLFKLDQYELLKDRFIKDPELFLLSIHQLTLNQDIKVVEEIFDRLYELLKTYKSLYGKPSNYRVIKRNDQMLNFFSVTIELRRYPGLNWDIILLALDSRHLAIRAEALNIIEEWKKTIEIPAKVIDKLKELEQSEVVKDNYLKICELLDTNPKREDLLEEEIDIDVLLIDKDETWVYDKKLEDSFSKDAYELVKDIQVTKDKAIVNMNIDKDEAITIYFKDDCIFKITAKVGIYRDDIKYLALRYYQDRELN